MFSLESAIPKESFVRVVEAFVDAIDLKSFGFAHVECKEEGRPPCHPAILLKLYLYGYHYGIRTTRKLEREAQTNMECMWLLTGLRPKYKTIADFRKDHSKVFREVFRRFVWLLKQWNLAEGQTIAVDSFKIRASHSLKKNFNEKKLLHHLEYIDRSEYAEALESNTKRVLSNPEYYRQRQQITERQFGTLKRQRGFTHTNVRGKEKVLGEVGLMFTGYNLKRCISVLGVAAFIKALKKCCLLVFMGLNRLILSKNEVLLSFESKIENAKSKNFDALRSDLYPNYSTIIV